MALRRFFTMANRAMVAMPAKTITCRAPPSDARCSSAQSRIERLPGTAVILYMPVVFRQFNRSGEAPNQQEQGDGIASTAKIFVSPGENRAIGWDRPPGSSSRRQGQGPPLRQPNKSSGTSGVRERQRGRSASPACRERHGCRPGRAWRASGIPLRLLPVEQATASFMLKMGSDVLTGVKLSLRVLRHGRGGEHSINPGIGEAKQPQASSRDP